jgi:hypothetical protein
MRVLAAGLLALALVVLVSSAAARSSCRFVLGFAALRDSIGDRSAGSCLEDEWATTSPASFRLGTRTVEVPSGAVVQRTTAGIFVWLPASNSTRFLTADGYWVQGEPVATYRTWDATEAQQQMTPAPASAPAPDLMVSPAT